MTVQRPNVFLVGAPKCGTSAMALYLAKHPAVCACRIKEPNYFCTDLKVSGVRTEQEYLDLFDCDGSSQAWLDGSVLYMYSQVAASAIAEYNPAAKILIMLRNPVDVMHAWHSQMLYSCYETISDFAAAVEAESRRRQGELLPTVGMKRECPELLYYRDIASFSEQMARFYDVFDASQIHVILHDDMKHDIAGVYSRLLEFLELDTTFQPDFAPVNESRSRRSWRTHYILKRLFAKPVRAILSDRQRFRMVKMIDRMNSRPSKRSAMSPELRRHLQDLLHEDVERVSEIIGRDCTHWTSITS